MYLLFSEEFAEGVDIRKLRKWLKISRRDFSDFTGIPYKSLYNWEQGIRRPPTYVVRMLLTVLQLQGILEGDWSMYVVKDLNCEERGEGNDG